MANTLLSMLSSTPIAETTDIIYYAIAAILTLAIVLGIAMLSKVKTAVAGNLIGSAATLLAIVLAMWYFKIFSLIELWIAMLIGAFIGIIIAIRVKMIQMPQLVALLNGFGGLASMITGILTVINDTQSDTFSMINAGIAIIIGGITFSGSMVAAGKLHKIFPQKPIVLKGHQFWTALTLILSLVTIPLFVIPALQAQPYQTIVVIAASVFSLAFGVIFSIRVGGADMPITISLLNSLTGVAAAGAGMAVNDILLVSVGGIVGASGLLLTQIMCKSMNRKLMDILLGKTSAPGGAKKAAAPAAQPSPAKVEVKPAKQSPTDWLRDAKRVIIVPGYGMALSQAQPLVKQLADNLAEMGKEVDYAIHPVAGRMPGHMNVLLAEVDIPYEKLREMDDINPEFANTDVVLVVGANDVVNPAANTAEGTPIYGMPILHIEEAQHIIFCNFDDKPGYAGVDNPLYHASPDKAVLLAGDAKATLNQLMTALMAQTSDTKAQAGTSNPATWLRDASKVIIVPGYGMALSQAQPLVKQLAENLAEMGKEVDYAIHPVAGRMPGHMNVLLAEVDVPYEKLREMDDINPEFANTDVVLVVGANDVVNPAANTAEDTPIYGMPILHIEEAQHIIFCNFDDKPGYAGVDNPLYHASPDKAVLLAGDAKATLNALLRDLLS